MSRRSRWGKGRRAWFICDRSGKRYPIREAVIEPGTGYMVHWSESDGMYNLVDHPQNFSASPREDQTPLKNIRSDSYPERDKFIILENGNILYLENLGPVYGEEN